MNKPPNIFLESIFHFTCLQKQKFFLIPREGSEDYPRCILKGFQKFPSRGEKSRKGQSAFKGSKTFFRGCLSQWDAFGIAACAFFD